MFARRIVAGLLLGVALNGLLVAMNGLLKVVPPLTCPDSVSAEEYRVLSTVAQLTLDGFERPEAVLSSGSVTDPSESLDGWLSSFEGLRGADRDFRCRNSRSQMLEPHRFVTRPALGIARSTEDWRDYSMRRMRFGFSRVGLSRDGTRAVVYVGYACGFLCGGGDLLALRRDAFGVWRVARRQWLWVS